MIAVRELNLAGLGDAETWFNSHLVYTHGYGLVAAAGNQRSVDGQPVFLESGIPSVGRARRVRAARLLRRGLAAVLDRRRARGQRPRRARLPGRRRQTSSQTQTTFEGDGGPALDNVFKKLVYAIKFQSEQIFLSDEVNDDSQILYDRDPIERVQKVAPYLTLDTDTYPSVVDGRIVWIVDGYTLVRPVPVLEQGRA